MKGIIVDVKKQEIKEIEDEMSFPEPTLDELKKQKLNELKIYITSLLSSTDYILLKIYEAQMIGNDVMVDALKQKYAIQLQQRQKIREWNENIKQAIQNAKTIDELRGIVIEFKE
jgi:hypothetical protein